MNTRELSQRLFDEGCNASLYAVGSRGAASDAFCLTHNGTQWEVYYTERGQDSPPIYASGSESQACEFFFKHIMAMRHDHCVGFFKSEQRAEALRSKLQEVGLSSWKDNPLWRSQRSAVPVFVTGKAIFPAMQVLDTVPVRDDA